MSNIVMEDTGMGLVKYLRKRPDLSRAERSPIRTAIFSILALVGIALLILAFTNPEMYGDGGSGRARRFGSLGMYIAPIMIAGVGITGIIRWSTRWRIPGGGTFRGEVMSAFTVTDPDEIWAVLESAKSADDPELIRAFHTIHNDKALPGSFLVDIVANPDDRIAVAAVLRHVRRKPGTKDTSIRTQLEREPVIRRGEDFVDFRKAWLTAVKQS